MTKRLATNACPRLDIVNAALKGALASGAVSRWQSSLPTMTVTLHAARILAMHHLETKVPR